MNKCVAVTYRWNSVIDPILHEHHSGDEIDHPWTERFQWRVSLQQINTHRLARGFNGVTTGSRTRDLSIANPLIIPLIIIIPGGNSPSEILNPPEIWQREKFGQLILMKIIEILPPDVRF